MSEIAERAARAFEEWRPVRNIHVQDQFGKHLISRSEAVIEAFKAGFERAIAESQADDLGKRAMKVLHDLTPGGSEFYNEPKRCAEYIQDKLDNQVEITKRAIIRAKNSELGDGEPSPQPAFVPFPDSVKLLINLRREMLALFPRYRCGDLQGKNVEADFGSMLVRIDTLLEPYDILESGAAQEVSPRIISRETFPELGGETTVEVFEAVSPPSPDFQLDKTRCAVCGWTLAEGDDAVGCRPGDCSLRPFPPNAYDAERANREYGGRREFKPALIETLGDTRELKAALKELLDAVRPNWQCKSDKNCAECELIQPIFAKAERLLG